MQNKLLFETLFHSDWDTSKTWFLNASSFSSIFWRRKSLNTHIFFLTCWNKKKLLGAKSGLNGGRPINSTVKRAGLSRCVRAVIVMVNNNSSCLVRFSNFCEDVTQTNCGVPLRIERRQMTSFAEEIGDHLLRSSSFTNNFRWIWFVFGDPHGEL